MIRIKYISSMDDEHYKYTQYMLMDGELVRAIIDMRNLIFSIEKKDNTVLFKSEQYNTYDKCTRELRSKLIELGVVLYDEVRGSKY